MKTNIHFLPNLAQFFLECENVSDWSDWKSQNTHVVLSNFS
jgi:hypothetical protein